MNQRHRLLTMVAVLIAKGFCKNVAIFAVFHNSLNKFITKNSI